MFNKIFDVAYYGAYVYDKENNLVIPYEFATKGKISEINSKIYDLRCKISKNFSGEQCDIDDYEKIANLFQIIMT